MSPSRLSKEILQDAIQKEELTRAFYRRLTEKVSNPSIREPLLQMAEEEQRHKDLLLQRLRKEYDTDFTPRDISGTDKYLRAEQEITTHEHVLVVLRTGMQLEDEAIDFYREQLDHTDQPDDVELLRQLIDFERGHREWLENEYKKASTSSTWLP